MKRTLIAAAIAALITLPAIESQAKKDKEDNTPKRTVTYALPSTTISFEVEAVCEKFYAGPYARFAAKYLGAEVRQKDEVRYTLSKVEMCPSSEADLKERYVIRLDEQAASTTFLKFTSSGLVSSAESLPERVKEWRFPVIADGDYAGKALTSNLTTEATTLYRRDKNESNFGRVAVKQDMLVEKSEESKAAEMASMIFSLREQKMSIITGDTDATYSGEAMGSAIAEITRLEQEYLAYFTGYSEYGTQKLVFDLVPEAGRENQIYIAFRISETAGLLPADNVAGKPVVLEIIPEAIAEPQTDGKKQKKAKTPVIYYRVPAICKVKLTDGMNVIMQGRIPVYQLGETNTLPVDFVIKEH